MNQYLLDVLEKEFRNRIEKYLFINIYFIFQRSHQRLRQFLKNFSSSVVLSLIVANPWVSVFYDRKQSQNPKSGAYDVHNVTNKQGCALSWGKAMRYFLQTQTFSS